MKNLSTLKTLLITITIHVNKKDFNINVKPYETLLDVLRDNLHLTGTKDGCSLGECGWDTVLMDGKPVASSLVLAVEAEGHEITTIEGLAEENDPVIKAFIESEHIQGGYDTPGKIMAAKALLNENPNPTVEEVIDALSGVLGREGTYPKDIVAVLMAAKKIGKGDPAIIERELKRAEEKVDYNVIRRENEKFKFIGKEGAITRANNVLPKATGQAKYTRDIYMPNMLYAKWLVSPYPHAKVVKINKGKALEVSGVVAVYAWEDKPFKNLPKTGWVGYYPIMTNEPMFEGDEAGVVVVGESEEACDKGLEALEIEWEPLPFILDPEKALKPDAPKLHPEVNPNSNEVYSGEWSMGNVEEGFKEADKVIEGRVIYTGKSHAPDDIGTAVAWWDGDNLHVWIKAQDPRWREGKLSQVIGIPRSKIHIHLAYVGGSFGGDLATDRSGTRDQVVAALISKLHNRPVKIVGRTRRYMFDYQYPTHIAYYKVGVKNDGTITAVHLESIIDNGGDDGGAAYFWNPNAWNHPMRYFEYQTKIPNLSHEQHIVWTNKPPTWWDRCEQDGTAYIYGVIMDHVARELDLDPTEVSLKNIPEAGVPSLKKAIELGKKLIEWNKKWHKPGERTLPNGKKHGIGFAGFWEWDAGSYGSSGLRIAEDGSVAVFGACPDIGVAAHTTYKHVIAEVLSIPPEKISFITAATQNTSGGVIYSDFGGSWTCATNVDLLYEASEKARKIILDRAGRKLMVSPSMLELKDGKVYKKDDSTVFISIPDAIAPYDVVVTVSTRPQAYCDNGPFGAWACAWWYAMKRKYPCYQAHFAEIEVDTETGLVEIKKIVSIHDVGTVIYPAGVEGQVYGGLHFAIGRILSEQQVWDPKTGVLLTNNLKEYKTPSIADTPKMIIRAIEVGKGPGAFGVVGVGEDSATAPLPAIANAIYNALGRLPESFENPFTPEKLIPLIKRGEQ